MDLCAKYSNTFKKGPRYKYKFLKYKSLSNFFTLNLLITFPIVNWSVRWSREYNDVVRIIFMLCKPFNIGVKSGDILPQFLTENLYHFLARSLSSGCIAIIHTSADIGYLSKNRFRISFSHALISPICFLFPFYGYN